jgi:hypothetical protein
MCEWCPVLHVALVAPALYSLGSGCARLLADQGIIKHTRMALTALGQQADIDIVQNLYE